MRKIPDEVDVLLLGVEQSKALRQKAFDRRTRGASAGSLSVRASPDPDGARADLRHRLLVTRVERDLSVCPCGCGERAPALSAAGLARKGLKLGAVLAVPQARLDS